MFNVGLKKMKKKYRHIFKNKSREPYKVSSGEIAVFFAVLMHLNFHSAIELQIFLVLILIGYLLWFALIY